MVQAWIAKVSNSSSVGREKTDMIDAYRDVVSLFSSFDYGNSWAGCSISIALRLVVEQ
jgi:hypothetical protein